MSLKRVVYSAGRWTAASLLARAVLQLAQTMLLARLLAPADFGLMAIAGAAYVVATLFADMGLSNALVHFDLPDRSALSTLYWLNFGVSAVVAVLFLGLGAPLASLYNQPDLFPMMAMMALAMPVAAAGQQFRVIAEKDLRFTSLAMIEVAAAAAGFLAAVATGMLQGGAYALVSAILASTFVASSLSWTFLSSGMRPRFEFGLGGIRRYLDYGFFRLGDMLFNNLQMQADVLVGGAVIGPSAMGLYTAPRELALKLANTVINPAVTRVGLPLMAKVKHDRAALKSVYLQTMQMTSSVNFPAYAMVFLWAPDIVAVLLGPQWTNAVPFMRLLAIWGLIRSTSNPLGSLVYATGFVRRAFWWNLGMFLLLPLLFWYAARIDGARGLAMTLIGIQLVVFYPLFRFFVWPLCGASFADYLRTMLPALASTFLAVGLGYLVSHASPLGLAARVAVGALATFSLYFLLSYAFNRQWLGTLGEILSPLLGGRHGH
jgi:O-antigen/teichoic acid export membrane protein